MPMLSPLAEPCTDDQSQNYQSQPPKLVQVLVDCPGLERCLTYTVPEGMTVKAGDILTVPLGERYVGAIALQLTELTAFEGEIKPVYGIVSSSIFPPHYWDLLIRVATYYRTSLIETVKAALPPKLIDRSSFRLKISRESTQLPIGLSATAQEVWEFLQSHADRKGTISRRYVYQKLPRQATSGLRSLQQLGYISAYLEPPARPRPKYEDVVVLLYIPDHDITERQRQILTLLQRLDGECLRSQLIEQAVTSAATVQVMVKKGYIAIDRRECLRLGGKSHVVAADHPKQLTSAQTEALSKIQALAPPHLSLLLHGVTGSGKTEVYLQAIAPILAEGKSALVLVPEIGLTPQLTDRFRARFGDTRVNVYHSQLSDGERFDTWRQMLAGEAQVVVGTRSAVFAPLSNLGLIVLDEEHDGSFKQDQPQPCYHARTVAQWRSQMESCPLVLGSATPSMESWTATLADQLADQFIDHKSNQLDERSLSKSLEPNLKTDPKTDPKTDSKTKYAVMPDRIGNRPMPPIQIIDMREELKSGNWSIISRELQAAIARMSASQKQGILFIHRRGYSTFVSCRSCGYVMKCPHCDVSLSYHNPTPPFTREVGDRAFPRGGGGDLRCHYCNHTQLKPPQCPSCGSTYLKHFGSGTQKVEQEIASQFPDLRVIRFDSDTTRNKDQHRLLLEKFQMGEADLLIGTQMLAKGIDIPQVTLVGVISADGLLNFSDYRSGERAFQVLTQVSGRAGRGEDPGEIFIQTYTPEHAVIQAVQQYAFDDFMHAELDHRAGLNYPPVSQMALIHLSSIDPVAVEQAAIQAADHLISLKTTWSILGPAPALITRVNNRYRWQILVKLLHESLESLPGVDELMALINTPTVRIAIDIDPLTIL